MRYARCMTRCCGGIHRLETFHWYARHIDPIWAALPDDMRGDVIGHRRPKLWRIPKTDVVLIGGAVDIDYDWGCNQVYVEHGAGQSYIDALPKSRALLPRRPAPTERDRLRLPQRTCRRLLGSAGGRRRAAPRSTTWRSTDPASLPARRWR